SMNGCNKPEAISPPPPGNEFLTTTELVAVDKADTTVRDTAVWTKLDPNSPDPPDTSRAFLNLKPGHTYDVQIILLDETQNPVVVVSDEIKERQNYHLFCFDISGGLNLTVNRTDLDTNNPPLPVGLTDNFITGSASNGSLEVILRHQPNSKNGTCDPGSTDLDVTFQINIQP
ncbi:MAG TPA: hypothetical protein VG603_00895, partial [Chitinophagales bacterium]|nr:hypothetical protein [Chitinophagales bacterium]